MLSISSSSIRINSTFLMERPKGSIQRNEILFGDDYSWRKRFCQINSIIISSKTLKVSKKKHLIFNTCWIN